MSEVASHRDPEVLESLYWEKEMSLSEIAEELGVTAPTIHYQMNKHGVETRTIEKTVDAPLYHRLKDKEYLEEAYHDGKLSIESISNLIGVSKTTVRSWFYIHGIETRKGGLISSGSSTETYYGADWDDIRQEVLDRDEYQCQSCGLSDDEHNERHGNSLHIHHIQRLDSFDDLNEANDTSNLVTLCSTCHRRWEGIPLKPEIVD